ncbi:hypothetical protein [Saccharopolyspora sp. ASAGF58]|uniref:hypothetical protein n=1 Tax=Saccharopolyspora sp. ASAGF58 TaxID=2719023 RepID=UPI00143FEB1C|nr:hypothetical protein [Saccharopolyspora sp. ASAGF58]QIZ36727.1 hypothetical protein FDZ84_21325 [Saccharopolyspora sp. ASAGF58]
MPSPLTWPHALFVMAFGLFGSSNRGAASGSQVTPTGFGARSAFGDGSGTRDSIFLGNGLTNGATGGGSNFGGAVLQAPMANIRPGNTAAMA